MGLKIEYFYISDSTNHFSQPNLNFRLDFKKLEMFSSLAKHFLTKHYRMRGSICKDFIFVEELKGWALSLYL